MYQNVRIIFGKQIVREFENDIRRSVGKESDVVHRLLRNFQWDFYEEFLVIFHDTSCFIVFLGVEEGTKNLELLGAQRGNR
jgi:hypothetical protein